jgi:hypothetical protein
VILRPLREHLLDRLYSVFRARAGDDVGEECLRSGGFRLGCEPISDQESTPWGFAACLSFQQLCSIVNYSNLSEIMATSKCASKLTYS